MRIYFHAGTKDESITNDRNNNGIIDAIDDIADLVKILSKRGYREGKDMLFQIIQDGEHDERTWSTALERCLLWLYGEERSGCPIPLNPPTPVFSER